MEFLYKNSRLSYLILHKSETLVFVNSVTSEEDQLGGTSPEGINHKRNKRM